MSTFFVESEFERQETLNYAKENLGGKILDEKVDHLFNKQKFAARTNLLFAFILKHKEVVRLKLFFALKTDSCVNGHVVVCVSHG